MKTYEYLGEFISDENDKYSLKVNCNGLIQAFILLTAEAIKLGKHYQLSAITTEAGRTFNVGNINKIGDLIYKASL